MSETLEDYQKEVVENRDCEESKSDETVDESILGDGLSFEDVEHLRKTLHDLEIAEYDQNVKITSLQDEYNRQKSGITWDIDQLIIPRKKDKEAMKAAGFTRQDDYEKYLRKNDLKEPIGEIEDRIIPIAESLEKARKEKQDAHLEIKNLQRKLEIRLRYAPLIHQTITVSMNMQNRGMKKWS
jgi:hypothetical protein